MASFDKMSGTSSSCAPTFSFTLAPKPIAAVAPLSSPLFFSEREGEGRGEEEEEGEGEEEEEEEEAEEEEEMVTTTNANADRIDFKKIRETDNANWGVHGYEHALVISGPQPSFSQPFNLLDVSSSSSALNHPLRPHHDDASYWDALRSHFSDPVTGVLMDDAMILTCGHSYGRAGMQQVYLTVFNGDMFYDALRYVILFVCSESKKECCKCSQPISADLVRPNFALRTAVQAFRREEELHLWKASKRKRDQPEQEKCGYDDTYSNDFLRNRASLFPLAISDRVIIKGNKRTPPRFVGRVAVVTEQCLNGWYVVKTLDNGESIKLQFGSLAKFSADQQTSTEPSRSNYPNWFNKTSA